MTRKQYGSAASGWKCTGFLLSLLFFILFVLLQGAVVHANEQQDPLAEKKDTVKSLLQRMAYDDVYCTPESVANIDAFRQQAEALLKNDQATEEQYDDFISGMQAVRNNRVYNYREDIAQIYMTTDNGKGGSYGNKLKKADGYVPAQIVIIDRDGTVLANQEGGKVKIRGNTTSTGDKKPYNIKLESKTDLFDFGKSKKWTLLADWYDPTLMRNALALDLAQSLENICTMDHMPVEVWMDGKYQGMYLLTEKIEADENRVDIDTETGDFLVEMDAEERKEEGSTYFYTDDGLYYQCREPEEPSDAELAAMKNTMSRLYTVLEAGDYSEVEKLIDVDSFVSYYILNEFLHTADFDILSVYFHCKGGKIYAGPGWDYDQSAGLHFGSMEGAWGAYAANCHYFRLLMKYPEFVQAVCDKYQSCGYLLEDTYRDSGWIIAYVAAYGDAMKRNWDQASVAYTYASFDEQVGYLRYWLSERKKWMDLHIARLSSGNEEMTDSELEKVNDFVLRMYSEALNRTPDEQGWQYWVKQLLEGKSDGAALARGFICSEEFLQRKLTDEQFVEILYKTFFDRTADENGKTYWLNELKAGRSRTGVLSGFVNSDEFGELCEKFGIARGTMEEDGTSIYNKGVRDFVKRCYTEILARDGELKGIEDWTHRINTEQITMKEAAVSFLHSEEFLNRNLSDADYVKMLYLAFLGREADDDGFTNWMNALASGTPRDEIMSGFADSEEFAIIMNQYRS